MSVDLTLIWAGIIAFGVFMYVLMDGFDLGIGILFGAMDPHHRDVAVDTIAPIWDGNETWLVLGGAGLLAAFPVAYSTLLPALYLPLLAMLIALVFRGVAFEFRAKAERGRRFWNLAFQFGSTLAAFAQGVILGAFVRGIAVEDGVFVGGSLDWLSPFALMVGVGVACGYALLGAGWLIMKTEGDLQAWARWYAKRLTVAVIAFMAVVSVWMPLVDPVVAARWFSWPNIAWLAPIPLVTGLVALVLWRSLFYGRDRMPFLMAMALFALGYLGLAVSLWPYAVPPDVTIWQAASPPSSQLFLLIGMGPLIPVILIYTGWSYWVFRGKVRPGEGYH